MSALEDMAAKLDMDPLDLFKKNISTAGERASVYEEELGKAAELIDWKRNWHPRGEGSGPVRRGLGLALHTWGGRAHRSNCEVIVYPDGLVEAKLGSQDLGTGTITVISIVLAETFGIPLEWTKVALGDSRHPASGPSGGSTTVGGVSSSTRRGAMDARQQLFERIAPHLEATTEELEAKDGSVRVKGAPHRSMTWKEATAKLGVNPITASGSNPGPGKLNDSGVGGVQMADVSVDMETGVVKINKMVAVQDCGLIINIKTAESQVYGALIMGVTYALTEEKIFDPVTGRLLNADMEFYKLAGIGDIGELVVHMMTGPGYDERGVIGLGEPPVISPGAAISNAVANAIGVRVPNLPLTANRVIAALEKGRVRLMNAFEYASPSTKKDAVKILSETPDKAVVPGRRHRSAEPDEGQRGCAGARGEHQVDRRARWNQLRRQSRAAHRSVGHVGRAHRERESATRLPVPGSRDRRNPKPTTAEYGHGGRRALSTSPLLVLPGRLWTARKTRRQVHGAGRRQPLSRHPG